MSHSSTLTHVEQDAIEGVIYLPENLFYNTTAPDIVIVLNRAKPKSRAGKMLLLNASRDFVKGDPKNFLPEEAVTRIAETFLAWKEIEKFSRIVGTDGIAKNDFNISPSRYIHTGAADVAQADGKWRDSANCATMTWKMAQFRKILPSRHYFVARFLKSRHKET